MLTYRARRYTQNAQKKLLAPQYKINCSKFTIFLLKFLTEKWTDSLIQSVGDVKIVVFLHEKISKLPSILTRI